LEAWSRRLDEPEKRSENVWVLEIGGRVDLLHEPLGLKHGGEFGP
ncbi:MAG: hypothetical protein IIA27_09605, partial [Gemmatimonadetes bacterium]|nr:hypothetical protein [Gemmatimonadota bacterium]